MKKLTDEELMNINGGKISVYVLGGIATFIIGLVDGWLRPLSCNR